jgi:hypothetical protein
LKLNRPGENAVRISLTPEDLRSFCISLDDFDYDNTKGKRVIHKLLEQAKKETGISINKEKIYIQLYPKQDGGCELFVIKLEEDEGIEGFSFDSFDHFYAALAPLFSSPDCRFYRLLHKEQYLALIPSVEVLPTLLEYGEKMASIPSSNYLRCRCKKILPKKEAIWNKKKRITPGNN